MIFFNCWKGEDSTRQYRDTDPISVADLYNENARTVYGPAIISRIADSMEYNTSMGVNNLIVSFRTASVTEMVD